MINSNLKVSVLISVYNQLHCIQKALESALIQDYENIEIIISDDCSTDGDVSELIANYDNDIKSYRNDVNLGANGNYRKLLSEYANGDYAVILNADDYWTDSNFISKAVNIFNNNPEVSLVFGDVEIYLENNETYVADSMNKTLPSIIDGNDFFRNFTKGYSLPHLTCIYHRQTALELDFYKSDLVSSDWESLLKLSLHGNIGYINTVVGVLTKHNDNYTKETNLQSLFLADTYLHNLKAYAESKGELKPLELDQWLFQMLRRHHTKWLIKLYYLNPNLIKDYKLFIKKKYPELYDNIINDYKYRGFLILKHFPFLIKWLFHKFLNQGSFIEDLISYQKRKNEL